MLALLLTITPIQEWWLIWLNIMRIGWSTTILPLKKRNDILVKLKKNLGFKKIIYIFATEPTQRANVEYA